MAGTVPTRGIRGRLKKALKELGPLRDVQLVRLNLKVLEQGCPDLKVLRGPLLREGQRQGKRVVAMLDELDIHPLKKTTRAVCCQLRHAHPGVIPDPQVAISKAFRKLMERYEAIRAEQPVTIHRFRVAFKRFRYMVEVFPPGGRIGGRVLCRMQRFQQSLGEIQDLEVMIRYLGEPEVIRRLPPRAMAQVRRKLLQRRRHLIGRFLETAGLVAGFWPLAGRVNT